MPRPRKKYIVALKTLDQKEGIDYLLNQFEREVDGNKEEEELDISLASEMKTGTNLKCNSLMLTHYPIITLFISNTKMAFTLSHTS